MQFASVWQSVTRDRFVLDAVSLGVTIEFIDAPIQLSIPSNAVMSYEMSKACDEEISALLDKKAIVSVIDPSLGFYSSIFLVPKKTGGYLPIINLKRLNSFIQYNHFKMEGMESVKFLIRQGDWPLMKMSQLKITGKS